MPVVAGPVLVFVTIEQGVVFGAQAAQATLAGLIGTVVFTVVYARMSRRLPWYACLFLGWLMFGATAYALFVVQPTLAVSLVALFAATMAGPHMLPAVAETSSPGANPRADLPLRLIATATLVLVLTAVADRVGPRLSGLLNAFPVLTTIIAAFTHAQRGSAATIAFVRAFVRSIVGFGTFCFVLALALVRVNLAAALLSSLSGQLIVSGLTLRGSRGSRLPELTRS